LLSPVIFFNLVLETIHGFQGFTSAFVLSNGTGGPVDSTLMYTLHLYKAGFVDLNMGYASAMAWVFLLVVGLITVVLFSTGRFWVPLLRLRGAVMRSKVVRLSALILILASCSTRCSG
jgi:multiple sugar transport system permease protein